MGYFDALVDGGFKTTEDGIVLFYPYGVLGKGYIVSTIQKKQEIRTYLKRFVMVVMLTTMIVTFGITQLIFHLPDLWWLWGLIYCALLVGSSFAADRITKKLSKELIPTDEKITLMESSRNAAKSNNIVVLLLLEAGAFLFIYMGFWMATDDFFAWYFHLGGILSFLFGVLGSVVIGYMITVKIGNFLKNMLVKIKGK